MTDIQKVFKVAQSLQIDGDQSLLGTGGDEQITIVSDYDLQEIIEYKEDEVGVPLYKKILKFFQQFYKDARENKTQVPFIMDFKCGVMEAGEPVRWKYDSIMKGYQMINDKKVFFIDCLQEKSVVKIDYLAFLDGKYVEFSSNYYFTFGDDTTYHPITTQNIITSLLIDGKDKIYKDGKSFKGLKRIYSALKLTDIDKSKLKFIVNFLNSKNAEINKVAGDLELIGDVLNSDFRKVPMKIIRENIKTLVEDCPKKYKTYIKALLHLKDKDKLIEQINNVYYLMMKEVNEVAERFIEKNKKKIDKLVLYGSKQANQ